MIDSKEVKKSVKFKTKKDWFKDLSIRVYNMSQENIKYVTLALIFDFDRKDIDPVLLTATVGRNYIHSPTPTPITEDILILPEGAIDVHITPDRFAAFVEERSKGKLNVNNLRVQLEAVVFDNTDSAWIMGSYMRRVSGSQWEIDKARMIGQFPSSKGRIESKSGPNLIQGCAPTKSPLLATERGLTCECVDV